MATILFRPFNFGKWFVLGFTAWLAGLMDGGSSSSGGGGGNTGPDSGSGGKEEFEEMIKQAGLWVKENADWVIPLGVGLIVFLIVLIVVLFWLSSRGKFMFLDNVVHDRALVKQPWREYREQGNSLFWWRLVFFGITAVIVLSIVGVAGYQLYVGFDESHLSQEWILLAVGAGALILLVSLVVAYIGMLLGDFVIPIMYQQSIPVTEAWRRTLSLNGANVGRFLLYALWRMLMALGSAFLILAMVVMTCCIGGIVLAIPVLGAVLLLPITVFFRSLGPEYLRQFGLEYDLWANAEDPYGYGSGAAPSDHPF
ncbi:MAG: hypothetical protein KDN20_03900 [Verrucomicrobiae bacterium]|nr:hypothetical protein [Verrucomicrobiae bacterium]